MPVLNFAKNNKLKFICVSLGMLLVVCFAAFTFMLGNAIASENNEIQTDTQVDQSIENTQTEEQKSSSCAEQDDTVEKETMSKQENKEFKLQLLSHPAGYYYTTYDEVDGSVYECLEFEILKWNDGTNYTKLVPEEVEGTPTKVLYAYDSDKEDAKLMHKLIFSAKDEQGKSYYIDEGSLNGVYDPTFKYIDRVFIDLQKIPEVLRNFTVKVDEEFKDIASIDGYNEVSVTYAETSLYAIDKGIISVLHGHDIFNEFHAIGTQGYVIDYWTDETGKRIEYAREYIFSDVTLTAHFKKSEMENIKINLEGEGQFWLQDDYDGSVSGPFTSCDIEWSNRSEILNSKLQYSYSDKERTLDTECPYSFVVQHKVHFYKENPKEISNAEKIPYYYINVTKRTEDDKYITEITIDKNQEEPMREFTVHTDDPNIKFGWWKVDGDASDSGFNTYTFTLPEADCEKINIYEEKNTPQLPSAAIGALCGIMVTNEFYLSVDASQTGQYVPISDANVTKTGIDEKTGVPTDITIWVKNEPPKVKVPVSAKDQNAKFQYSVNWKWHEEQLNSKEFEYSIAHASKVELVEDENYDTYHLVFYDQNGTFKNNIGFKCFKDGFWDLVPKDKFEPEYDESGSVISLKLDIPAVDPKPDPQPTPDPSSEVTPSTYNDGQNNGLAATGDFSLIAIFALASSLALCIYFLTRKSIAK